jgi:hypothetical protein
MRFPDWKVEIESPRTPKYSEEQKVTKTGRRNRGTGCPLASSMCKKPMKISMIPAPVSLLCFPNWRVEAESLRTLKQLAIAAVRKTGRKTTAPTAWRSWNFPNYALTAGNPSLTPAVRLRECSRPSERPTGSISLILGNQIYRNSNSS